MPQLSVLAVASTVFALVTDGVTGLGLLQASGEKFDEKRVFKATWHRFLSTESKKRKWQAVTEANEALDSKDPHCRCVPWQDAYTDSSRTCGEGRELAFEGWGKGLAAAQIHAKDYCRHFFERLPGNMCVFSFMYGDNFQEVVDADMQWCYVGDQCKQKAESKLNGDANHFGSAHWKFCQNHDNTTRRWSVEKIVAMSKEHKLNQRLLATYLWNGIKGPFQRFYWDNLKQHYLDGHWQQPEPTPIDGYGAKENRQLRLWTNYGGTYWIRSKDVSGAMGIVADYGRKIYELRETEWAKEEVKAGRDPEDHPDLISEIICIKGCEEGGL